MDNIGFVLDCDVDDKSTETRPDPEGATYSFGQAVDLTETGKFHYILLLVCGMCFMSVMVGTMGVGLVIPFMKCEFKPTIEQQGLLASAGFLGIVLSSHASGFLADTWGRVKTLRTALIAGFIADIISAFSVNIWMLIVFRFLNGLAIAGCQACVFSYCGEFHGHRTRTQHVTFLSVFLPLGLMYMPAVAMAILPIELNTVILGIKFLSWRCVILANSSLPLVTFFCLMAMPESPKYLLSQEMPRRSLEVLQMVFKFNTGKPISEYPVKQLQPDVIGANLKNIQGVKGAFRLIWDQTAALFYKERCLHTLNICFLMFVIYFISQGLFLWFPSVLSIISKGFEHKTFCQVMSELSSGANTTSVENTCGQPINSLLFQSLILIGVGFTGIYLIFGLIINIVGKTNLLLGWLGVIACSCVAVHWTESFRWTTIFLTFIMAIGSCGGIVSTISVEYFPTKVNAMGMCLVMMVGRLGAAVGSNIMGRVIFRHCDSFFYVLVGVTALIGILVTLLPKQKHVVKKEQKVIS